MKKFFYPLLLLTAMTFTFTSCDDDDDDFAVCPADSPFACGTFVLNEGNMSDGNGTLTFIGNDGSVVDSAYYKVNGTFLGNASEDLWIEDGKVYIISQNGAVNGGDGLLVVADAKTLKKQAAYNAELAEISRQWPSHIAVEDHKAYIRANDGIHLFDLNTHQLKFIAGTEGAAKNRMVEIDDEIYAIAGNKILVINGDVVVRTIQMEGQISGILETEDDRLWVACTTTPAQICLVNAKQGTIAAKHEITESGVGAGWGSTPGISAKGDYIYFSDATTKIYRHIFSENKTELMVDVADHVENANIVYNTLGVHPVTGEVFFNTIKGYGMDYLTNDITVFNFNQQEAPVANYKNHTAFPAGFFFTQGF